MPLFWDALIHVKAYTDRVLSENSRIYQCICDSTSAVPSSFSNVR